MVYVALSEKWYILTLWGLMFVHNLTRLDPKENIT
nr:MAG TPA: hypothetical protein [Caudoviricetes sp.]